MWIFHECQNYRSEAFVFILQTLFRFSIIVLESDIISKCFGFLNTNFDEKASEH